MTKKVRELMSEQPITLASSAPVSDAARRMRDADVGAVVVQDDSKLCGIVTDRDIVVRALAEGKDPHTTSLSDICSKDLTTLSPDDDADRAVELMRQKAIRRVLVAEGGKAVGIVSLGDLAVAHDGRSVLGQISSAPANQ